MYLVSSVGLSLSTLRQAIKLGREDAVWLFCDAKALSCCWCAAVVFPQFQGMATKLKLVISKEETKHRVDASLLAVHVNPSP